MTGTEHQAEVLVTSSTFEVRQWASGRENIGPSTISAAAAAAQMRANRRSCKVAFPTSMSLAFPNLNLHHPTFFEILVACAGGAFSLSSVTLIALLCNVACKSSNAKRLARKGGNKTKNGSFLQAEEGISRSTPSSGVRNLLHTVYSDSMYPNVHHSGQERRPLRSSAPSPPLGVETALPADTPRDLSSHLHSNLFDSEGVHHRQHTTENLSRPLTRQVSTSSMPCLRFPAA